MEVIDEIVQLWREQLLLDEWREIYDSMSDDQKKIVRLALGYPSGNEVEKLESHIAELEQDLARVRDIFPWHRGDEGYPDVPVLQSRYDALRERVRELEYEAGYTRPIDPGDSSYPNPVEVAACLRNCQEDLMTEARFVLWQGRELDRLQSRVEELENITSWKQQRMASDTGYLPFVEAHYWYEPERGPVIYAGEANHLEKKWMDALEKVANLTKDM